VDYQTEDIGGIEEKKETQPSDISSLIMMVNSISYAEHKKDAKVTKPSTTPKFSQTMT